MARRFSADSSQKAAVKLEPLRRVMFSQCR